MNLILIHCFALLAYLNCLTETKDFCQGFVENGHRISYTHIFNGKSRQYLIDVVINDFYWQLETNKSIQGLEFVDTTRNGKQNMPFYKSQYSFSLAACEKNWTECSVLLINTNSWKALIGSSDNERTPESIRNTFRAQMKDFTGNPISAFQTKYHYIYGICYYGIVFVEYNKTTGQLNASAYGQFNLNGSDIKANPTGLDKEMAFLKKIINKTNLLSLSSVQKNYRSGYILLFEENGQVMWCWNYQNSDISDECKTGQLLVDCSSVTLTTEQTKPRETIGSPLWMAPVIIMVCIVIAVLLSILFILCFIRKKSNNGFESTSASTVSTIGVSPGPSKTLNARLQTSKTSKISAVPSKKISPKSKI